MTSKIDRIKDWFRVWPAVIGILFVGGLGSFLVIDNVRMTRLLEKQSVEIAMFKNDKLLAEKESKDCREDLLQASFDRDMNQEALDIASSRGSFFADQGNELLAILRKHDAALVDYLNFVSEYARYSNPIQAYEAEKEFSKAREKLKKDIEKWQDAFVEFEREHAVGT